MLDSVLSTFGQLHSLTRSPFVFGLVVVFHWVSSTNCWYDMKTVKIVIWIYNTTKMIALCFSFSNFLFLFFPCLLVCKTVIVKIGQQFSLNSHNYIDIYNGTPKLEQLVENITSYIFNLRQREITCHSDHLSSSHWHVKIHFNYMTKIQGNIIILYNFYQPTPTLISEIPHSCIIFQRDTLQIITKKETSLFFWWEGASVF